MLLGIPYHAGLIYSYIPRWFVLSPDKSEMITVISACINGFRMPAFFMVAGFFSAMVLRRKNRWNWLYSRWLRLGVPFLAGMVLIGPIQSLILSYLVIDVNDPFGYWLVAMQTPSGHRLGHLWFLPPLIFMSTLFALLWPYIENRIEKNPQLNSWSVGYIWIFAGLLVLWEVMLLLLESRIRLSYAGGILSLKQFLTFLPYYIAGAVVMLRKELQDVVLRFDPVFALVGIAGIAIFIFTWLAQDAEGRMWNVIGGVLSGLFFSQLFFALCKIFFDRPSAFSDYFSRNAFTIYIFHHPIVICFGALMIHLTWPPMVEYLLLIVITLVICMGACSVVNRSSVLRFMFSGVPILITKKSSV